MTDTKDVEFESSGTDVARSTTVDVPSIDAQYGRTIRGLSPRHVQFMAIAGSIGTGLFVGIGSRLSQSGPLSLLLGYLVWGLLFIWPCNLCVAEMCAYLPVRGSIFELASRFVDPALGFAMGWTYFYTMVMLVCTEYSSVAMVMQYWTSSVNPAVWIAGAMMVCVALNVVAVKYYGEAEFVMASTKVLLILGLILLTVVTMCGGNPRHDAYGFRHWKNGNAMHAYYADGAAGRFLGWWKVVLYAAFTISGPDMVALAAGEMQNPRRTIPRVTKLIFYRLLCFYVLGVLAVGVICSSRDERLLGALGNPSGSGGSAASPWVIGIESLGISGLSHVINAAILLSGLSCANASLYSASRSLYGLARDGQAPEFLMRCTRSGVPIYTVGLVSVLSCITFLVSSHAAVEVFNWFVDLATTGLIATYTCMLLIYIFWCRARGSQRLAHREPLPYVAPLQPYGAYFATGLGILALVFTAFDAFVPFKPQGFVTGYFCLPYSAALYVGCKVWRGTELVRPDKADLVSGKAAVDDECREWEEGGIDRNWRAALVAMPFWRRCWERLW